MITERVRRNTVAMTAEDVSIWAIRVQCMPELLEISFENDRRDAAAMFAWLDRWHELQQEGNGCSLDRGAQAQPNP